MFVALILNTVGVRQANESIIYIMTTYKERLGACIKSEKAAYMYSMYQIS